MSSPPAGAIRTSTAWPSSASARTGFVLTFSCSHFVDETLFQQVVFQAASEAGRRLRLVQKHRQAFAHPVNIYHPETAYLKGFLLYVD